MVWGCLPMDIDVRLRDCGRELHLTVQQRGEAAFNHSVAAQTVRDAVANGQLDNLADVIAAQIRTRVRS